MENELQGPNVTLGLHTNIIIENGMTDTMRMENSNSRKYQERELLIRQSSPSKVGDTDRYELTAN